LAAGPDGPDGPGDDAAIFLRNYCLLLLRINTLLIIYYTSK